MSFCVAFSMGLTRGSGVAVGIVVLRFFRIRYRIKTTTSAPTIPKTIHHPSPLLGEGAASMVLISYIFCFNVSTCTGITSTVMGWVYTSFFAILTASLGRIYCPESNWVSPYFLTNSQRSDFLTVSIG